MLHLPQIRKALEKDLEALKEKQAQHKKIKDRYTFYVGGFMFAFFIYNMVVSFETTSNVDLLRLLSFVLVFVGISMIRAGYRRNEQRFLLYYKSEFLSKLIEQIYPGYEYSSKERGAKKYSIKP